MENIVWLIIDVASFAIFAIAGVTALARRDDVPTLDKTWAAPDSAETDFSSVRRFAIGAGVAALVYAVVMFAAVPAVLWVVDTAASAIAGVVCGGAAVGAVALFFADRICLRAPKDGKTAAKGAESEKDFGKVAKNR